MAIWSFFFKMVAALVSTTFRYKMHWVWKYTTATRNTLRWIYLGWLFSARLDAHWLWPLTRQCFKLSYVEILMALHTCIRATGRRYSRVTYPRLMLSWPRSPDTNRNGFPAQRRSPIQVLTKQCTAWRQTLIPGIYPEQWLCSSTLNNWGDTSSRIW